MKAQSASLTLYHFEPGHDQEVDVAAGWRTTGKEFPDVDSVRTRIHSGMYRPSIGHYEFFD